MTAPAFATSDDLAAMLGTTFTAAEKTQADRLLAAASDEVRAVTGQTITRDTTTAVLPGVEDYWLPLPQSPVVSVQSVVMDGKPVTDFQLIGGKLYRWWGWQDLFIIYEPRTISVTYTHGYASVPGELVTLVCALASAAMQQSKSGQLGPTPGLVGTAIDDFREQYATGSDAVPHVITIPPPTAARLRARYGGGASGVRA